MGDYGHFEDEDGDFKKDGNILDDAEIDESEVSVEHRILHKDSCNMEGNHIKAVHYDLHRCHTLVLYDAIGLSLNNLDTTVLKRLATRLQDKDLITMVVRCSDFHYIEGRRGAVVTTGWPKPCRADGSCESCTRLDAFFHPLYQMMHQIVEAGGKSSVMLPFLLILFQPLCSLQSSRWFGVQRPCKDCILRIFLGYYSSSLFDSVIPCC